MKFLIKKIFFIYLCFFKYYLRTLNDYKNKLNQARQCDIQTKNDISNNFQNFDLISLSHKKLNEKIPLKIDSGAIEN